MKFEKNNLSFLRIVVSLIPIQLFFLFFIIQMIANNFFYENNYGIIYGASLLAVCILFLFLYFFVGVFSDKVYNKEKRIIFVVNIFFVFLTAIIYGVLFLIFDFPIRFSDIFSGFFSIDFITIFIGIFVLLILNFIGIYSGFFLRKIFL